MRRKVGAETLIRSELDPLWDLAIDPDHTVARTRLGDCEMVLL